MVLINGILLVKGLEVVKDFELIEVPHFSKHEAKECLENYHRNKLLSSQLQSFFVIVIDVVVVVVICSQCQH